jgi:hypothetical protein
MMWMKTVFSIGIIAGMLTMTSSVEASSFALLGGGELDTENQSSFYTGIVGEKKLQENLSITGRLWTDYLNYEYDKGGVTVKTKAPGFQAAVGVKLFGESWYTVFSTGWQYRNTNSEDPKNDTGATNNLLLQLELDKWFKTATNVSVIASYSTNGVNDSYTWTRGRVKQEIMVGQLPVRLGGEIVVQGNEKYNALQVGPLLELCSFSRDFCIGLHGGYKNSSSGSHMSKITNFSSSSRSAYGGFELYYGF